MRPDMSRAALPDAPTVECSACCTCRNPRRLTLRRSDKRSRILDAPDTGLRDVDIQRLNGWPYSPVLANSLKVDACDMSCRERPTVCVCSHKNNSFSVEGGECL